MARSRLDLQTKLEQILGSKNVYFSPPNNIDLSFPRIVYQLNGERNSFADNIKYRKLKRYTVTLIDEDPDSPIQEALDENSELPYISSPRYMISDGLSHFVYDLYF